MVLHLWPDVNNPIKRRSSIIDYIRTEADGQLTFTQSTDFLRIPSCLYGFINESTSTRIAESERTVILFKGFLMADDENLVCDCCGTKMHVNNHPHIMLSHLPFGGYLSSVSITRNLVSPSLKEIS